MSFSRTKDCLLESELPPGAENAEEQRPPLDQTGKSLSHPSEEGARQSLEREAVSCWSQCFPEGAGFSEAQKQVVTPRLNNINSLCLSRLRKNPKPVKDEMKPKNVISRCKRTSTGSNTLKMSKKQRNFHQIRVRTLTPMMFKGQLFIYIYKERELLKWREKVKAGAQDIGSVKETILREEVRNERLQVKNPLRSMENSSPKRPAERTAARNTRSQALKLPMHPAGTKIAFPSWLPCEFPISTSDLASQPKLKSFIYFYEPPHGRKWTVSKLACLDRPFSTPVDSHPPQESFPWTPHMPEMALLTSMVVMRKLVSREPERLESADGAGSDVHST
ncbi:uncharacterized protein LOC106730093 isoform X3 [Camelus ferus]|uniref:Uncharacterized protein LOC106730093 isoform X3 n=1 Tax=Camelus ferus TaxID=419612 RepID=A0A8B8SVP8_CAMFR|nr:uncharacterized protein LOC106730093 isoform X3 [Camelus ferus]